MKNMIKILKAIHSSSSPSSSPSPFIFTLSLTLLLLLALPAAALADHSHCICGASGSDPHCAAAHDETPITWTEWTSNNSLPATAGNYYLANDVTLTATYEPPTGVNLCLNGHIVKQSTAAATVITVKSGRTFTMTDCDSTAVHNFKVGENGLWTLTSDAKTVDFENLTARPAENTVVAVKGGVITGAKGSNARGIDVSGTNNLYHVNVIGNHASDTGNNGAGVYAHDGGVLNGEGCRICGNVAKNSGGGVQNHSTVNLRNSKISFNKCSTGYGGGLGNNGNGTTTSINGTGTLTDCEIIGNEAKWGGGVHNGYKTTLKGTTVIAGNTATTLGGGVSGYGYWGLGNAGQVTIDGRNVCITGNTCTANAALDNYAQETGYPINLTGVEALGTARIGIGQFKNNGLNIDPPTNITTNGTGSGTAADVAYFTSDDARFVVAFNTDHLVMKIPDIKVQPTTVDNTTFVVTTNGVPVELVGGEYLVPSNSVNVKVVYTASNTCYFADGSTAKTNDVVTSTNPATLPAAPAAPTQHKHCICGDGACTAAGHTHSNIIWTAWTSTTTLPTTAGNWYLANDVTLAAAYTPVDGVKLCLNGKVVKQTAAVSVMTMSSGTFTFTDCDAQGRGAFTGGKGANGAGGQGGFLFLSGGTVNQYGGVLRGNSAGNCGGAVKAHSGGIYNLYNGVMTDNVSANNGNAVQLDGAGVFNMYGGTIAGNHSDSTAGAGYPAGAIHVWNGQCNLFGGTITNNWSTQSAGGVSLGNTGVLTIGGDVKIVDNTGASVPNNVYLYSGTTITLSTTTPLAADVKIGVTTAVTPTAAQAGWVPVTGANTANYAQHFWADAGYAVINDANVVKLAKFGAKLTPYDGTARPTSGNFTYYSSNNSGSWAVQGTYNGVLIVEGGVSNYYYETLQMAIEAAKAGPVNDGYCSDANPNGCFKEGTPYDYANNDSLNPNLGRYTDVVTLCQNANVIYNRANNNKYATDATFATAPYGVHKGIVIDLNGYTATGLSAGKVNADEMLVIRNGTVSTSGDAFDDEAGTGYLTGKVVFSDVDMTGKVWASNHAFYFLNGHYNITLGPNENPSLLQLRGGYYTNDPRGYKIDFTDCHVELTSKHPEFSPYFCRVVKGATQMHVAFHANHADVTRDGAAFTSTNAVIAYGSTTDVPTLVCGDLIFAGWAKTEGATTPDYRTAEEVATMSTEHEAEFTLYAVWADKLVLGEFAPLTQTFPDAVATADPALTYKQVTLMFTREMTGETFVLPTGAAYENYVKNTSLSTDYSCVIDLKTARTAAEIATNYLRQVKFRGCVNQELRVVLGPKTNYKTFYNIDTKHYYQYVPFLNSDRGYWTVAYESARGMFYAGRQGYLVTVTSVAEDIFVYKASNGVVGWMGGTTLGHGAKNGQYFDGFNTTRVSGWYWACGPECGEQFYDVRANSDTTTKSRLNADMVRNATVNGYYFNWDYTCPEPNQGNSEDALTTLKIGKGYATYGTSGLEGANYSWNNITYQNVESTSGWAKDYRAWGFVVEYGDKRVGDTSEPDEGEVASGVRGYAIAVADIVAPYVAFNAWGGCFYDDRTWEVASNVCVDGVYTLPSESSFSRSGYDFGGWFESWTNGAAQAIKDEEMFVQGPHMVYAKWISKSSPEPEDPSDPKSNDGTIEFEPVATNADGSAVIGAGALINRATNVLQTTDFALPEFTSNGPNGIPYVIVKDHAFAYANYDGLRVEESIAAAKAAGKKRPTVEEQRTNCLSSVTISTYVTNIQSYAFAECEVLTNVTFSQTRDYLTGAKTKLVIGDWAFANSAVSSVVFPADTCVELDVGAFADAPNLEDIYILGDVSVKGKYPFAGAGRDLYHRTGRTAKVHLSAKLAASPEYVLALTNGMSAVTVKLLDEIVGTIDVKKLLPGESSVTFVFTVDTDSSWLKVSKDTLYCFWATTPDGVTVGTGNVKKPTTLTGPNASGEYTATVNTDGAPGACFFKLAIGDQW